MPVWIVIVALLSIALTALLTSVLMRVSGPKQDRKRDSGDGSTVTIASGSSGGRDKTADGDSAADSGGGDGGGD